MDSNEIRIVSGEGTYGTVEVFSGRKTELAVKRALTRERCHGDRWARAIQYSHSNEHGDVGVNLETGEYCSWPTID